MFNDHFLYIFAGASWSSIFAGAVSALALGLVMAVIGLALGFKTVEPKADDPAAGLGKTLGLWYALSVLVSISGGAYVAGLFAARRGLEHGFMVWALVTIVLAVCGGHAVGAAMRGLFSTLRGLGSGAAGLAGAAGKGASQTASGIFSHIQDHLQPDLDMDKISGQLNDNVLAVLRDTGSETLQPEHLKRQFREIKGDLRKLARQLALDPTRANKIIADFLDSEKGRLRDLTKDVDRDMAVTTLRNNRNIPQEEAETMVDNAVEVYGRALDKARDTLNDIRQQMEEAKDHLKDAADLARDKADRMTDAAAKGAAATALAVILAAVLSLGFGYLGVKCAQSDWHQPISIQKTIR